MQAIDFHLISCVIAVWDNGKSVLLMLNCKIHYTLAFDTSNFMMCEWLYQLAAPIEVERAEKTHIAYTMMRFCSPTLSLLLLTNAAVTAFCNSGSFQKEEEVVASYTFSPSVSSLYCVLLPDLSLLHLPMGI